MRKARRPNLSIAPAMPVMELSFSLDTDLTKECRFLPGLGVSNPSDVNIVALSGLLESPPVHTVIQTLLEYL